MKGHCLSKHIDMFLKSFQEPLKLDFKYPNATVMKVIVFVARVGMLAAEKDFLRTFLFFLTQIL